MHKPRIVYIHGDGVFYWRWGWVEQLHDVLRAAGYPTWFELMPDSIEARARYWLPFLRDHVQAGEHDVLLGWSCGAVAAMRYAQTQRVHGLILVAPYYTDLGSDEVRRSGFVREPWDWAQLRANAPRIAVFHSDADPYIPQSELATLARALEVVPNVIAGAGHFAERATFPELADYVQRTYT